MQYPGAISLSVCVCVCALYVFVTDSNIMFNLPPDFFAAVIMQISHGGINESLLLLLRSDFCNFASVY